MTRKLVAEFIGTAWLVLGGCGAAVLAAAFPALGIGFVGVSLAFGLTVTGIAFVPRSIIALLILGGGAATYAYIVHSRRVPAPVIDLSLFKLPSFRAGVVGLSDQQVGVMGRSNKLVGVYGFSEGADGVVGEIPPTSAFYAGKFFGRVLVNGDLTVAGFDDAALATTIWPELTTVRQPITEMAGAAVDLLVKQIRARREGVPMSSEHVVMGFSLIRRQSDAAPRVRCEHRAAELRADFLRRRTRGCSDRLVSQMHAVEIAKRDRRPAGGLRYRRVRAVKFQGLFLR